MNDALTGALLAVPHYDTGAARAWFEQVCSAYAQINGDGGGDEAWTGFRDALLSYDVGGGEKFVSALEGLSAQPLAVVAELVGYQHELTGMYFQALVSWVSDAQRQRLAQLPAAGGEWAGWLVTWLDEQWPQWRDATSDVLAAWLDDWMPHLLASFADPGAGSATDCDSEDQLNLVEAIRDTLTPELHAALVADPELREYMAQLIAEEVAL